MTIVHSRQLIAGTAMAGISQARLAREAGVHRNTLRNHLRKGWVRVDRIGRLPETILKLERALFKYGVVCITSPGIGSVRVSQAMPPRAPKAPTIQMRDRANQNSTCASAPARDGVKESDRSRDVQKGQRISHSQAKVLCGARTRKGTPCVRLATARGRCSNHGAASAGPKEEGRRRIAELTRARWAAQRAAGIEDRRLVSVGQAKGAENGTERG